MIWLSRSEEFKRIILSLNADNLEFMGVFKFLVREKKIVKLHEAEVPQYCLYLSAESGAYGSTVTVSKKKYEQVRTGGVYGLCGIIKNIKYDDFILVTDNTDPDTAIWQAVRKARGKLLFIMIVLGLGIGTLLLFMYPMLHLI